MSTFERQNLKKSQRLAFRASDHALERFRERVDEEFTHRSSDDLADLLNARLRSALLVRDVTDPRMPEAVTTLYLFECRTGARQVAVVRESCVVTVLEEWMAGSTPVGNTLRALRALAPAQPSLPSPSLSPSPVPAGPSDEYLVLAAECRELAARSRSQREQKAVLEERLRVVTDELQASEEAFASKRERLLVLMTGGDA